MAAGIPPLQSRIARLIPGLSFGRSTLFYALYTLILFVAFLAYTFPHDLVVRRYADRLAAESGWVIRYGDVSLVPWAGYRAESVELAPGNSTEPYFQGRRISFRPTFASLFGNGLSAVAFHADAYGGTVSGQVDRSAPASLELSLADLDLAAYPLLERIATGTWEGRLSGELRLEAADQTFRDARGGGELKLDSAGLAGGDVRGFKVPDLHFQSGQGEFEVNGPRLEIRGLKLAGREADVELRGQIYLRTPLRQSVITSGSVTVRPLPGAGDTIDKLLTLLNRNQRPPGGTFTYALYGTLFRPRVR